MNRRSFLKSLISTIVCTRLALELTAKEPVIVGLDIDYADPEWSWTNPRDHEFIEFQQMGRRFVVSSWQNYPWSK